jgi:hypothetical protein
MLVSDAGHEIDFTPLDRDAEQNNGTSRPAKVESGLSCLARAGGIQDWLETPVCDLASSVRPSSEETFTAAVAHFAGNLQTQPADVLYHNIANSRIFGKKKSQGAHRAATYNYYAAELVRSSQPEHMNKIGKRLRDDCSRIAQRLGHFMELRVRIRHELTQAPFRPIQSQKFPI